MKNKEDSLREEMANTDSGTNDQDNQVDMFSESFRRKIKADFKAIQRAESKERNRKRAKERKQVKAEKKAPPDCMHSRITFGCAVCRWRCYGTESARLEALGDGGYRG